VFSDANLKSSDILDLCFSLKVNEGNWDVIPSMGTLTLLALLELWISQLGKPGPEISTMFVNAVGVIRIRRTSVSSQQVGPPAIMNMIIALRLCENSSVS
jgi:hypothetical protein